MTIQTGWLELESTSLHIQSTMAVFLGIKQVNIQSWPITCC